MAEDNSWVFDSLVCFLHGPVWNAPLQTFIEEKSIVFDPNECLDESNPQYIKIHEEYKNLVDYMLASFMDEMQITPEQFEGACLESKQNNPENAFSFHQGLFQQIWAANDIKIFIRLMTQRNVELQLQALDLIERRHNTSVESNRSDSDVSTSHDIQLTEDDLAKLTIGAEKENELLEEVINQSGATNDIDTEEKLSEDKKFKRLNLYFEKEKINSADIKSRQEYLRNQRDKILEIKKKNRTQLLNDTVKRNVRPSSAASVASRLMQSSSTEELVKVSKSQEASVQLRQTLAKRLRAEVVEPKDN